MEEKDDMLNHWIHNSIIRAKLRKLINKELKRLWFSMDHSNVKEKKEIIVEIGNNKFWPGYGDVEMLREGPGGYSSFKTHQENPLEYAKNLKEYRSGEYKLIIK